MSLSVRHRVQLGNWGTIGLLGQNLKATGCHQAHFLLHVHCFPHEYESHIAGAVERLAEENFATSCTWLWPSSSDDGHRLLFSWNLSEPIRTPQRLVMAAARRFEDAEQRGKQSFASALADIAAHRDLQPSL